MSFSFFCPLSPPTFDLHSSELHFLFKPQTLMLFLLVPGISSSQRSFFPQGPPLLQPGGGPNRSPFWNGSNHICSHSLVLKKANALAECFLHTLIVCVSKSVHIPQTQRTTCRSRLSPRLCGSWGLNSCCLAWWQTPLSAELNSVVWFDF